jgi:hypothetical protein
MSLRESRVRENCMHGLSGGRWPASRVSGCNRSSADTSRITRYRPIADASEPFGTLWSISGDARSCSEANGIVRPGTAWLNSRQSFCHRPTSFTHGPELASPSHTQGGSPVRESRPPGSVRGVLSNECPYRDRAIADIFSDGHVRRPSRVVQANP